MINMSNTNTRVYGGMFVFKHKTSDGNCNLSGRKICVLRKNMLGEISRMQLADKMKLKGIDMDKTAIRRIENGERYITDIELKMFCEIFRVSSNYFLGLNK